MSKKILVKKGTQKCACCNIKTDHYYVSLVDRDRSGPPHPDLPSLHTPLHDGVACSPEHALQLIAMFLEKEMEHDGRR